MKLLYRVSFLLTMAGFIGCSGSSGGDPDTNEKSDDLNPTLSLNADHYEISKNGKITITWEASNVVECMATGAWEGSKDISGSEVVGPLQQESSFTLNCSSETASIDHTFTVKVLPDTTTVNATPTVNLNLSTNSVDTGGTITITWNSENAESCVRVVAGAEPSHPVVQKPLAL